LTLNPKPCAPYRVPLQSNGGEDVGVDRRGQLEEGDVVIERGANVPGVADDRSNLDSGHRA